MDRQRIAEAAKGVGRPKVGGTFKLVDHEGKKFTDEDIKGGFTLVSELRWFGCKEENTALENTGRYAQDRMFERAAIWRGNVFMASWIMSAEPRLVLGVLWLHPLPRYLPGRT